MNLQRIMTLVSTTIGYIIIMTLIVRFILQSRRHSHLENMDRLDYAHVSSTSTSKIIFYIKSNLSLICATIYMICISFNSLIGLCEIALIYLTNNDSSPVITALHYSNDFVSAILAIAFTIFYFCTIYESFSNTIYALKKCTMILLLLIMAIICLFSILDNILNSTNVYRIRIGAFGVYLLLITFLFGNKLLKLTISMRRSNVMSSPSVAGIVQSEKNEIELKMDKMAPLEVSTCGDPNENSMDNHENQRLHAIRNKFSSIGSISVSGGGGLSLSKRVTMAKNYDWNERQTELLYLASKQTLLAFSMVIAAASWLGIDSLIEVHNIYVLVKTEEKLGFWFVIGMIAFNIFGIILVQLVSMSFVFTNKDYTFCCGKCHSCFMTLCQTVAVAKIIDKEDEFQQRKQTLLSS